MQDQFWKSNFGKSYTKRNNNEKQIKKKNFMYNFINILFS